MTQAKNRLVVMSAFRVAWLAITLFLIAGCSGGSSSTGAGGEGTGEGTISDASAGGSASEDGSAGDDDGSGGANGDGDGGAGAAPGGGELSPPPNDLDAGDGTLATGGDATFNGKIADTPGNQTGCQIGGLENQFIATIEAFGGDFGLKKLNISVFFPRDLLTESRVFDVGPFPDPKTFAGHTKAAISVSGPATKKDPQRATGGTVWVKIVEGVPEVRFQDIPTELGDTVSGALLCDEPAL